MKNTEKIKINKYVANSFLFLLDLNYIQLSDLSDLKCLTDTV